MKSNRFGLSTCPLIFSFVFAFLLFSCRDEEELSPAIDSKTSTSEVNAWILENMQTWYYWSENLPKAPNKLQDPESFFKSLLNTEDRFSWIQDNYEELLNSLQGVSRESGYEYVLYRESEGSDNVIAQILYIKPNSPAQVAGLKRGDVITHVNDQVITTANYQTILKALKSSHSLKYKPLIVEEEAFGEVQTLSLNPVEYAENPNYLHQVLEVDGKKIGYYVYNFFASGTTDNGTPYDDEMDAIFNEFKSKGITDLIIDLRFNSGGSETSATNLASNLGVNVNSGKVFFKREYNPSIKTAIINDPDAGEEFLVKNFLNKGSNIGSQLNANRVYILTSSRTASASELIINGLRPYMEVFLIGDTTYGKNVGSISLYDEKNPDNKWGMQPIVMKAFNSLDQSNYSSGFEPSVVHKDNRLFIYPLGDRREALLSNAISQITGTAQLGRRNEAEPGKELIGHSLDTKKRSYILNIDSDVRHVK